MPREYLPYAIIETAFVFTDPRFTSLPPLAKLIYLMTWCRAFNERRSTLPPHVSHPSATARDTGIDLRTTRKYVQLLHDRGLTILHDDGSITVPGVRGKSNLRWKDDPGEGETITPGDGGDRGKTRTQTRQEREGEGGEGNGMGSESTLFPLPSKKPAKKTGPKYTPEFEVWWNDFPKGDNRASKFQTFRNWNSLLKEEGIDTGLLIACKDNYKEEVRIKKKEPKYIYAASNFVGLARHFEAFAPGTWTPPKKQGRPVLAHEEGMMREGEFDPEEVQRKADEHNKKHWARKRKEKEKEKNQRR